MRLEEQEGADTMTAKDLIVRSIAKTLPKDWQARLLHGKLKLVLWVDQGIVTDLIAEAQQSGNSMNAKMRGFLEEMEGLLEELLWQAKGMLVKPQGMVPKPAEEVLPIAWAEKMLKKIRRWENA